MWSKFSLRTRIVLLSALCLALICTLLTAFLVITAGRTFATPYADLALAVPSLAAETLSVMRLPSETVVGSMSPVMPTAELTAASALTTERFMASATSAYIQVQETYSSRSYWAMGLILLAGIALIWITAGKALEPVTALSKAIEDIDEQNLSQPIDVPESGDEVSTLTRSFNHMLSKISTAYEAQRRFAQNAAHELKTPVAAILTNVEVTELTEDASPEEMREALDAVKENALRMARLIEDMMSLQARVDEADFTDFLFSDMLLEIGQELKGEMDAKGVSVCLSGDMTLRGNRPLLTRAFANVLHNAVRYNAQDGRVDVVCMSGGVTIHDTGEGIETDKMDKLFEPFYCADASRSKELGGTGLGLSIAKQIFDLHGMRIAIASDHGTTVSIFTNRSQEN